MTSVYEKIIALLESSGVAFEQFEHEHVHTSHDAAKTRGTKLEEAAKALVLQTGSGVVIQCIVSGHRKLDLKKIKELLGEKNLSLAHPDVVLEKTGCPVGTVPPFGNLFNLPVYADQDIFSREHVVFSAGTHHNSVRMRANEWATIVGATIADIGKDSTPLQ